MEQEKAHARAHARKHMAALSVDTQQFHITHSFPRTRRSHPALWKNAELFFSFLFFSSFFTSLPRWNSLPCSVSEEVEVTRDNGNDLDVFLLVNKGRKIGEQGGKGGKKTGIHQVIGRRLGICFRFRDVFFFISYCVTGYPVMWFSVSRGTETQPGLTEYCANRIIPTPTSKAPFSAIVERKNEMFEYLKKRKRKKFFLSLE